MEKKELDRVLSIIHVFLDLEGGTREEVLFNIAGIAKRLGLVNDEEALYNELVKREGKASTAIGFGVAVPEANRIKEDNAYVFILCRLKEPVDFKSQYKKPVRIILLSLGSKKADLVRFKAMLYLSTLLKSARYRKRLMQVKKDAEIYGLLKEIFGNYGRKLGK